MVLQINAEKRNIFGKKLKKSREEGKLPAVLYGKGVESTPVFISLSEFKKAWKKAGESTLIEIKIDDSKAMRNVLISDVAFDLMKNEPLHVDFHEVEMNKLISANVPLVFDGIAPAVKELGGVLVKIRHEVEVEALPKDLPHEIKVDISSLTTFEDQILVSGLSLPKEVKILTGGEEVIALVEEVKEEKVEEKEMTLEDIEVEKKGKKEEEGTEGEDEKASDK